MELQIGMDPRDAAYALMEAGKFSAALERFETGGVKRDEYSGIALGYHGNDGQDGTSPESQGLPQSCLGSEKSVFLA